MRQVDMNGERYDGFIMPDWVKQPHHTNMAQADIPSIQKMGLDRRPISEEARRLADHALNLQQDGNYPLAGEYMVQAIERAQQDAVKLLAESIIENLAWMKGSGPRDVNKASLLTLITMEEERG